MRDIDLFQQALALPKPWYVVRSECDAGKRRPLGAAAAAVQQVTPANLRAQASALFLFANSVIGYCLGPTSVALVTDYLFGSDAALRYSLALVCPTVMLSAAIVLALGCAPFRRLSESLAAW